MTKYHRVIVGLSALGLCTVFSPTLLADASFSQGGSYGEKIGNKALNGFSNIIASPLEIPKNIISVSNQSNVFYGLVGGVFKGIVNTAGRIGVGVTDLITFSIPTQPIAQPVYIWNDFDTDTTYGDVFRLDNSVSNVESPPIEPVAEPIATPTPPPAPPVQYTEPYLNNDNAQKLDTIFQERMMK